MLVVIVSKELDFNLIMLINKVTYLFLSNSLSRS